MRKLAVYTALALSGCALGGCAKQAGTAVRGSSGPVTPNYPSIVGMMQTNYALLTAAAAVYIANPSADPMIVAKIKAAEADAGPLVTTLSATSAPTTIQGVLIDLSVLAAVPGVIAAVPNPSQTQADITLGLSIMSTVAQIGGTAGPRL
jgi:hypothetical protein